MEERVSTPYETVRKKGQKHIYLRIRNDGRVVVTAPYGVDDDRIDTFVKEKEEWIQSHLARLRRHARTVPERYDADVCLWYLGASYPVDLLPSHRNAIRFEKERFLFFCRNREGFSRCLERFYRDEAQSYIAERVRHWSDRMGLYPRALRFRRYKSRWGSCSPDGTLSFNTALIRYDPELIDYVVVHELAHIRHKNHGKSFWSLVSSQLPQWPALRKRLL